MQGDQRNRRSENVLGMLDAKYEDRVSHVISVEKRIRGNNVLK